MFTQRFSDRFLRQLDQLDYGALELTTPEGKAYQFGGKHHGPVARLEMRDWRAVSNLIARGDVGFADSYQTGDWDANCLKSLFILALQNEHVLGRYLFASKGYQVFSKLLYAVRRNSVSGSRRNIHAHYDLGNAFYQLWLDPSMTYSAGLFTQDDDDLCRAQMRKYDRILTCLGDRHGRMLEIGCGWGGMAERALTRGDYDIKAITISGAQHEYAQQRLRGRANIALEDYRHQTGKYDQIVSIEMFEAVGKEYWRSYFNKVKNLLSHHGRAVIQTITIDEKHFQRYSRGSDMIRSYIFPGGMLPSPQRFATMATQSGLRVEDTFFFGQDYARTLEHWLSRFDKKVEAVKALGFDSKFIRLWRFYLAACIAGFATQRINVMQVELSHS